MKNKRINGLKKKWKESREVLWKLPKLKIHHYHIHNYMEVKKIKLILKNENYFN